MAIYVPGLRDRHKKPVNKGGRQVVVILSLTAMVDMFTVLVVFLLQNYKVDEIKFKQNIPLPEAVSIKKTQPSNVVAVSDQEVFLNEEKIVNLRQVKNLDGFLVRELYEALQTKLKADMAVFRSTWREQIGSTIADPELLEQEYKKKEIDISRVTLQANKEVDFLTLKKILFSATEAGASEINFAVIEKNEDK